MSTQWPQNYVKLDGHIQREIGGTIRKLKQFNMLGCAFFIILISLNVIGIISETMEKSHLVLTVIL